MDLLHLLVTIVFGAIVFSLVTSLIPMTPQFKTAIYFASCLWLVYVVLGFFGVWPGGTVIR